MNTVALALIYRAYTRRLSLTQRCACLIEVPQVRWHLTLRSRSLRQLVRQMKNPRSIEVVQQ